MSCCALVVVTFTVGSVSLIALFHTCGCGFAMCSGSLVLFVETCSARTEAEEARQREFDTETRLRGDAQLLMQGLQAADERENESRQQVETLKAQLSVVTGKQQEVVTASEMTISQLQEAQAASRVTIKQLEASLGEAQARASQAEARVEALTAKVSTLQERSREHLLRAEEHQDRMVKVRPQHVVLGVFGLLLAFAAHVLARVGCLPFCCTNEPNERMNEREPPLLFATAHSCPSSHQSEPPPTCA